MKTKIKYPAFYEKFTFSAIDSDLGVTKRDVSITISFKSNDVFYIKILKNNELILEDLFNYNNFNLKLILINKLKSYLFKHQIKRILNNIKVDSIL